MKELTIKEQEQRYKILSKDINRQIKKIYKLSIYDSNHDNILYNQQKIHNIAAKILNKNS